MIPAGQPHPDRNPMEDANQHNIHIAIVRTCRRILSETRAVIYGENVFNIRMEYPRRPVLASLFSSYDSLMEEVRRKPYTGNHFDKMRHFRIEVRVGDSGWIISIQDILRSVLKSPSHLPRIDHVEVTMYDPVQSQCHVLEVLASLRNVPFLTLHGVSRVYAAYLQSRVTGSGPVGRIPEMYTETRELCMQWLGHWVAHWVLGRLRVAMETRDVRCFWGIKTEVMAEIEILKDLERQYLAEHEGIAMPVYIDLSDS